MPRFNAPRAAHRALRAGAAFAFLYPPLDALFEPYSWIGYFPAFVRALPVPPLILLHTFGALEVVLALWMLSGVRVRTPAILATLMLLAIVSFNATQFPILFRDLAIATMTLALALWPAPLGDNDQTS